ncbi:hypothetical protein B296_00050893 [Ensete ventricosum]|uniref:glycerophosphodiester phosphodiesterase n=1 Tax=Ensete ventricosum TaxID=4639 RepID=A0A426X285_ENSVE|nr:hypothetical protein B296_00050893 [Ensete ventricosum]
MAVEGSFTGFPSIFSAYAACQQLKFRSKRLGLANPHRPEWTLTRRLDLTGDSVVGYSEALSCEYGIPRIFPPRLELPRRSLNPIPVPPPAPSSPLDLRSQSPQFPNPHRISMALKAVHVSDVPSLDQPPETPVVALSTSSRLRKAGEGWENKAERLVVIGHRGKGMNALASPDPRLREVKENSLRSFNEAARFPIDFVEFDVQVYSIRTPTLMPR